MRTYCKYTSMVVLGLVWVVALCAQVPIYLGKAANIIATYKVRANEKANNANTTQNKITHTIPGQDTLVLNVNVNNKLDSVEIFIGDVDKSNYSNFFLRASGNHLTGYIVLPAQKKAYQYYSKTNGDTYLKEVDINKVICVDYGKAPTVNTSSTSVQAPIPVPILESLPGAGAVVLLDFDGQHVVGTAWNGGNVIDAAPANLSTRVMEGVWKIMSEDFRPFNLNITTDESVFLNAPLNRRMRVIFTPTREWFGNDGGVAYVNSFNWGHNWLGMETPCWVFNSSTRIDEDSILSFEGEAGSHETGHTLGLNHDGRNSPYVKYHSGQDNWAPIMGRSYDKWQTQWSKGEYPSANNHEDDLSIISSQNGFTYRLDDHSNTKGLATSIGTDAAGYISSSNKGIITTSTDVDVFYFKTTGGPISLRIVPSPYPSYANLDVKATLKNATNTLSIVSDPREPAADLLIPYAPPGYYYLFIDGAKGALGADSDYGSLGEYTIYGSYVPEGIYVMNTSSQRTCSGTFYDPGHQENYANNLNITETFTPATFGNMLRFNFTSFDLLNSNDYFYIYNGANTNAPLIGVYRNNSGPGIVTASNLSGQLTFRFISNSTVTAPGWTASISCIPPLVTQWDHRFGGTGNDNLTATIKTTDGGYLLGGYTNSSSGGDKTEASRGGLDYWIVKLSENGIKQWDKRYGGTSDDSLTAMVQTADGGYLLGGNSFSGAGGDKSEISRGGNDFWVIKISGDGTKLWDKRFGTIGAEDLASIISTNDGGYLLFGSATQSGGDKTEASRGGMDYWAVKISSTGIKQWDKRFGGSGGDRGKAALQTTNGGYLLAGYTNSGAGGDKSENNRGNIFTTDYWIVRIAVNGSKIWDKRYGGGGNEILFSIIETSEGEYLIGGSSSSNIGGDKSETNRGIASNDGRNTYPTDYWVVKIFGIGQKLWDKTVGGSESDDAKSLIKTSDGGCLVAGSSASGIDGDKTEASRGQTDYWIVKLHNDGTKLWDNRFGASSADDLKIVLQATDNGFILAGKSASGVSGDKTEASRGGMDYWILKTTSPFSGLNVIPPNTN